MLRLFVIAAGALYGISVAANRPPTSAHSDAAFATLVIGLLFLAFFAGRRYSAQATATAVASAISHSFAQAFSDSRSSASVVLNLPASPGSDGSDHKPRTLELVNEDAREVTASSELDYLTILAGDPDQAAAALEEATGQRFRPDVAAAIFADLSADERTRLLGLLEQSG